MGGLQYPANVRVMKVPCVGILQVQQILEAFRNGASGVMIVGCKEDGCHYEGGSQKAGKKIELAKVLLAELGVEPERLEMFNMVFIEGDKFAEAARMMSERVARLGPLHFEEA